MKTLKRLIMLGFLLITGSVYASQTTYEPYVVRNAERTAENTVRMLEGSPHFWLFQEELQKNTGFQFGVLAEAVERGTLVTKPCGTCRLETAGVRNGKSAYHRLVRPEEPVAYLNDMAVFLPACGNPVRALEPIPVPRLVPQPAPPQAVVRPPAKPLPEGCVEGPVIYTTERLEYPVAYGSWGFPGPVVGMSGGGFSWTTDHHQVKCYMNIEETEE